MKYISVSEMAQRWDVSERTVRNYCANGKIQNAFLLGKTWNIPEHAQRPERINKRLNTPRTLLEVLKTEKKGQVSGGVYHKIQIELTYHSNHLDSSSLTHDQTRHIYETNTIDAENESLNVDDIVEAANHFRSIDIIIDQASHTLTEAFMKQLHAILKNGTSDSRKNWFVVGGYKKLPNEVGKRKTTPPEQVQPELKELLSSYNAVNEKTLAEIIDFHARLEQIHPFQDGNGRIGRLIMFKECLRNNIVPFIIEGKPKIYDRGLKEWANGQDSLKDLCLSAQDRFKKYLDYFRITYQ